MESKVGSMETQVTNLSGKMSSLSKGQQDGFAEMKSLLIGRAGSNSRATSPSVSGTGSVVGADHVDNDADEIKANMHSDSPNLRITRAQHYNV
eukprot:1627583-Karenia_brevis.AAC.1